MESSLFKAWRRSAALALLLLAGTLAWGDPPDPKALAEAADRDAAEFIQQFHVIRVGITKAPGQGHQAYAITVMKRLRELGFKGEFEVYYDPKVKAKLENLILGFNANGPEVQELPAPNRITAIEWRQDPRPYGNQQLSARSSPRGGRRAALGIMGGDDFQITPEQLNVDALIRVQPTGWRSGTIALDGQNMPEQWKEIDKARYLPSRARKAEITNVREFLQSEMGHAEDLRAKIPGLRALLENLSDLEMMSAYGLHHLGPKKLTNLIASIDAAGKSKPGLFKGPVVIPLLSTFDEGEWKLFNELLDKLPGGRPPLKIQSATAMGIESTVKTLKAGEILLMPVGPVTQDVWNTLLEKSTLPPTVEGVTGRSLGTLRGRPFISAGGVVPIPIADKDTHNAAMLAHNGLLADESLKDLTHYIVKSMDASSDVSQAFEKAGNAISNAPDKVSVTLSEAKTHFEATLLVDPAPGAPPPPRTGHCIKDSVEDIVRAELRDLFD
jgi:hypothetical protein